MCKVLLRVGAVAAVAFGVAFHWWVRSPLTLSPVDLSNKVVVVTGGTDGIGKETARILAEWNATVVLPARNLTKAEEIKEWIGNKDKVLVYKVALDSFKSVQSFAKSLYADFPRGIHVLINNAGMMRDSANLGMATSQDGVEIVYQVNYLSHFLLSELLLDLLETGGKNSKTHSRIVHVSSFMHLYGYLNTTAYSSSSKNVQHPVLDYQTYSDTKLFQLLYSFHLSRGQRNITSNAVHPGAVVSQLDQGKSPLKKIIAQSFKRLFGRSAFDGAKTQVIAATSHKLENVSGMYFSDRCIMNFCDGGLGTGPFGEHTHPDVGDIAKSQWLYQASLDMTKDFL